MNLYLCNRDKQDEFGCILYFLLISSLFLELIKLHFIDTTDIFSWLLDHLKKNIVSYTLSRQNGTLTGSGPLLVPQ